MALPKHPARSQLVPCPDAPEPQDTGAAQATRCRRRAKPGLSLSARSGLWGLRPPGAGGALGFRPAARQSPRRYRYSASEGALGAPGGLLFPDSALAGLGRLTSYRRPVPTCPPCASLRSVGPCKKGSLWGNQGRLSGLARRLWAHPHGVTETLWILGDWLCLEGEQALLLRL